MVKVHDPNAVRIMETGVAENDNAEVYLVPAAHNFYLEEASLSIEVDGPASGFAYLYWLRGSDLYYVRDICQIWIYTTDLNGHIMAGATPGDHAVFPSGLLIPAGDMLVVVSEEVGLTAEGNISGFLVSDYA